VSVCLLRIIEESITLLAIGPVGCPVQGEVVGDAGLYTENRIVMAEPFRPLKKRLGEITVIRAEVSGPGERNSL